MKKFISILLILMMVLGLAACGNAEAPAQTTAPTEAPAAATEAPVTETEVPTEAAAPQAESPLYGDVLDAYYDALEAGWGPEKYMEAGMNYLPGMIQDADKVGYYLEDLDGDGIPELMIGAVGENYIYVMYTMVDGAAVTVIHASERNTYQLLSDGSFYNRGSNGAASTGHQFFTFDNGSLNFQDALMFDANADSENPWFYTEDEDWDVSNDTPYGTGDAEAYIKMIEESVVEIPYMAFSGYHD